MMQLIRITDSDDAFLKRLISLYEESFPLEERRPVEQLKRLMLSFWMENYADFLCFGISKRSIIWNISLYILI